MSGMAVPVLSPAARLAILIPTRNRPAMLIEAVNSVVNNGDARYLIIVSDQSGDEESRRLVEGLNNPRVRYVRADPGSGKVGNWQNALDHVPEDIDYCMKLDDDDVIYPGFVARCIDFLDAHLGVSAVYTGWMLRNEKGETTPQVDRTFFREPVVSAADYIRAALNHRGGMPGNHKTAAVYRHSAARAVGGYRATWEDYTFSCALALQGDVGYVPDILFEYRLHPGNGVKDVVGQFRHAYEAAVKAMRVYPPQSRMPAEEWVAALDKTRNALPFIYLLGAAMTSMPASYLLRMVRAARDLGDRQWRVTAFAWLLALIPAPLLRWVWRRYQTSGIMHWFARKTFFRAGATQ